jgi:uncharacterized protein (TIGR03086 family)
MTSVSPAADQNSASFTPEQAIALGRLDSAVAAVDELLATVGPEQWGASTPCTEWAVRDIAGHLIGVNRVFVAVLADQQPPQGGATPPDDTLLEAYRESSAQLRTAFERPGALEHEATGFLGNVNGAQRLQLRIADLITHGWDLARALDRPVTVPDDLAEEALAFTHANMPEDRGTRFGPEQPAPADAPAIDRLVAFLGRPLG